jgi:ApbE superfamily uncharacterized protein (UPF0280 family)
MAARRTADARLNTAATMQAQRAPLSDGRWHFQHGPIDLVIGADGDASALAAAHAAAWQRFETVLTELVAELPLLRRPVRGPCPLQGVIARRMWWACHPFHSVYITPMAAVAGAVAQELIAAYARDGVRRAWINNGGDIALHLAEGASVNVGVVTDISQHAPFGLRYRSPGAPRPFDTSGRTDADASDPDASFVVDASMPVRGIATSGWRGRSFSLGIADSVTVLAKTAAMADAAATIIGNAVDIDDPRVVRRPANELKDDSDLGELLVTVDVPLLPADAVQAALVRGRRRADDLRRDGLIHSALLMCQQQAARVDPAPAIRVVTDTAARQVGSVFA